MKFMHVNKFAAEGTIGRSLILCWETIELSCIVTSLPTAALVQFNIRIILLEFGITIGLWDFKGLLKEKL